MIDKIYCPICRKVVANHPGKESNYRNTLSHKCIDDYICYFTFDYINLDQSKIGFKNQFVYFNYENINSFSKKFGFYKLFLCLDCLDDSIKVFLDHTHKNINVIFDIDKDQLNYKNLCNSIEEHFLFCND